MKTWSELAQACEAKGIKYSPKDDANVLKAKLSHKVVKKT